MTRPLNMLLGLLLVTLSASRDASQEVGANYAVPLVLLLVFSLVTAPLLILPYAVFVEKEKVKVLTVLGAMTAVAGLAVLALAKGG